MAPRGRDKTPDNAADEPKTRFFNILKEACVDHRTGVKVWADFVELQQKYSLEGDSMEWLIPGAYAHAISQKPSTVESKILMINLLKATQLSVPSFYSRLRRWVEMSNLPTTTRDVLSHSERYFQISRFIFERFEQMFTCIFRDPLDPEVLSNVPEEKTVSLRRKNKVIPGPKFVQPIDIYMFSWDLFIRVRRSATVIRDELTSSYHLLICVLDCVYNNVLALRRPELLNSSCSILPKTTDAKPEDVPDRNFSLIPYLCTKFDGITRDCQTLHANGFLPVMQQLLTDHHLLADHAALVGMLTRENYDKNFKNLNTSYEYLIRISTAADERVLLVSQDVNNPGAGGDPLNTVDVVETMKERRKLGQDAPRKLDIAVDFRTPPNISMAAPSTLSPLTPTSSCSALERREAQESTKSPALRNAVELVNKLTMLCNRTTNTPSPRLVEMLRMLYDKDVSADFRVRAGSYREKLVKSYSEVGDPSQLAEPYIRQRFMFAEIWYYKLLEDVLVSENLRVPMDLNRMRKLADSEKFQKMLFAVAIELILFSYNCSRMFPWPLEMLGIVPYDFVKIIEPLVHLEPLPRSLIKHLGRIEESILEQMVWKSDSPLWADAGSDAVLPVRDVCWPHHLEEDPSGTQQFPSGPMGSNQSYVINQYGQLQLTHPGKPPKTNSICFFFRKVYGLASSRLRDLCDKLGFDSEKERQHHVFQRMFTLFEHTLTHHTDILKDRHLDQILLCCAYVVAKLEAANGLGRTFHQIMNAYRFQPQAESRIYRSVLITVRAQNMPETRRRSQAMSAEQDPTSGETRADIINFYNTVFVKVMQGYISKFSPKKGKDAANGVMLSPVPKVNSNITRRQIHPAVPVWVSPLQKDVDSIPPPPGGRILTFSFGVSGEMDALACSNNNNIFPVDRYSKYNLKRDASADTRKPKRMIAAKPVKSEPVSPVIKLSVASTSASTKTSDVSSHSLEMPPAIPIPRTPSDSL